MGQFELSERRIEELRALIYEHGKEARPDHTYVLVPLRTPDGEVSKWWSSDEIKAVKHFLKEEMGCTVLVSGRDTHFEINDKCGKWAGIKAFLPKAV